MKVTKAIIPAGGLGTRFLPVTKAVPKEMLPILDKPAIQYIVEEGARAGIRSFVVVTGKSKKNIEDHFDLSSTLDSFLREKKKTSCIENLNKIVDLANFIYIRQKEPLGLGHAVWTAKTVVSNEYVSVMLPDEIILSQVPAIQQLMLIAHQEKCSIVGVQEVPLEDVSRYGVIGIKRQFSPNLFQVKELVEKPKIADAPSNLAIIGRYVISPDIFDILDESKIGFGGEIQLTDAIQSLIYSGEKVFAYKIQGTRYDVGNPLGLLKANLDFALRNPQYSDHVLEYLQNLERDYIVMEGRAAAIQSTKGKSVTL
jgi:UTP--glucose-1-phosphate uridylyltransferase